MSRRLAALAALFLFLAMVGCGGKADTRPPPNRPAQGYHPERFPDIPLPAGFALDPARDQLAIAVGGGLLRRFDVSLLQKTSAKSLSSAEILEWYGKILPGLGWSALAPSGRDSCFRRSRSVEVAELLRISAGSSGGSTSVHLRLEPAPPATTTP